MNARQFNPNRQAEPAGESDEQLLDDLAAGHVGELARRHDAPRHAEAPADGEQAEEPCENTNEKPDRPQARASSSPAGEDAADEDPSDYEQRREDHSGDEGGAVDELLSAVERIAGGGSSAPRRNDPLLGSARRRPRFRLGFSAKARAVLWQSAAVAAGAAGSALLAWLMFGQA